MKLLTLILLIGMLLLVGCTSGTDIERDKRICEHYNETYEGSNMVGYVFCSTSWGETHKYGGSIQ